MPPQTPRSNAKAGASITPSFSFGLGLLPSFRFGSPRNINLLTSLSPQRFFNRFNKKEGEAEKKQDDPFQNTNATSMDSKQSFGKEAFDDEAFDLDRHSDSLADSADIWSLTNDSQYQSLTLNLTSINEDSSPKTGEPFLSPHEMFLKKPAQIKDSVHSNDPAPLSSPVDNQGTPASTSSRSSSLKRKHSLDDSPCTALVAEISRSETLGSTPIACTLERASKDLWFAELDDFLLQCHQKYKRFKASQSPKATLTKLTSQNQVLSKMLYKKTGIERSSKQIASRLSRLRKIESTKLKNESRQNSIPFGNGTAHIPKALPLLDLRLQKVGMSFKYKRAVQGVHDFLFLTEPPLTCIRLSSDDLEKDMPFENRRFKDDFKRKLPDLGEVPIYVVTGIMNFKSPQGHTSTPVSPLTDPGLFNLDNGTFLSVVELQAAPRQSDVQFLAWKSHTTIYKDEEKVLLNSREQINGYRNQNGMFDLQVPFMNHFWAGYLTFLSNGSNTFDDVCNLFVTQEIYEGDNGTNEVMHAYIVYRFQISLDGASGGHVKVHMLPKVSKSLDDDLDDNATVLVHSSPLKGSPHKNETRAQSTNNNIKGSPQSVPTYNASLLHQFNPNYDSRISLESQCRPLMTSSQSTSQIPRETQSRTPLTAVDPPTAPPFPQASAGQMSQGLNGVYGAPWSSGTQYNPQMHPQMHAQAVAIQAAAQTVPQNIRHANETGVAGHFTSERYIPVGHPARMPNNPIMMPMHAPDNSIGMNVMNGVNYQGPSRGSCPGQFAQPPTQPYSAPATQLHFFPQGNEGMPAVASNNHKLTSRSSEYGELKTNNNNITFGPILGYDPLRDIKPEPKKPKNGIHKFTLNPQIMYKPKKQ